MRAILGTPGDDGCCGMQYMIMGQAAAVATVQAMQTNRTVQSIDVQQLQTTLKIQGAILSP